MHDNEYRAQQCHGPMHIVRHEEKNEDLISTYSRLSTEDMLKICAVLVEEGRILEAWQVLYLAKII